MHILIGLCLGLALLYYWLLAHWFARVLVFLLLGAVFATAGYALGDTRSDPATACMLALIGGAAAWFAAAIPTWYWTRRISDLNAASEARDKQLTRETIERFNRTHGLTVKAPRPGS